MKKAEPFENKQKFRSSVYFGKYKGISFQENSGAASVG